jgi:hypothetical protein
MYVRVSWVVCLEGIVSLGVVELWEVSGCCGGGPGGCRCKDCG